jgi:hypothetical protein
MQRQQQQTPEQVHKELDHKLQSQFPQFEIRDQCIGKHAEHARYKLTRETEEYMQILHTHDCLYMEFTLARTPNPSLMVVTEEAQNLLRFRLKLLCVCTLDEITTTTGGGEYPAVNCVQYGEERLKRRQGGGGRCAVKITINIPRADLSMALALAVLETMLLEYF